MPPSTEILAAIESIFLNFIFLTMQIQKNI